MQYAEYELSDEDEYLCECAEFKASHSKNSLYESCVDPSEVCSLQSPVVCGGGWYSHSDMGSKVCYLRCCN